MTHSEGKAKASLLWALYDGRDDGDADFADRRVKMKGYASSNDTENLLLTAKDMFARGHIDESNNLYQSEHEDPGGPLRWAREIMRAHGEL